MKLNEILKRMNSYNPMKYISTEEAHSEILKWIKEKLPKEMPFANVGKTTDGFILGFNEYRQQALKNLGREEVK